MCCWHCACRVPRCGCLWWLERQEWIDCGDGGRDANDRGRHRDQRIRDGNRDGCAARWRRPGNVDQFDFRRSRPTCGRVTDTAGVEAAFRCRPVLHARAAQVVRDRWDEVSCAPRAPTGESGAGRGRPLLDKWWASEATKRGWIVVSPVAPDGQLFFSGSSATLIELMDAVAATYAPEGGKFHLAGVSNGGLSAYRIALDAPKRFASLLVAPGFPPDDTDKAKLKRLVKIPVASYVGEQDSSWREASVRTVREFNRLGGRATLTVSPGEGHILTKITARQLFDVLEKTRPAR